MRGLLIFAWCVVTALMFYSAWRFKAPEIQTDIAARVTEGVVHAGGQNIDVEVDGRHVNLRGYAMSLPQKATFLETADKTYGALGPTDGLVLPNAQARTFLSATSQDGKLLLTGVVGSEKERDLILAEASGAGFGKIEDDLTVTQGEISWADNASAGFAQLAGLSNGHLYVSNDRSALSGTAPSAEIAAGASELGEGWSAFVNAPAVVDPRIAELESKVAERDTTIVDLTSTIGERDTTIAELQANGKSIEATANRLQSDLTASEQQIIALQDERSADKATIDTLQRDVEKTQQLVASVSKTSDARIEKISQLQEQLDQKELSTNNLQSEMASMASSLALLKDGNGEVADTLREQLANKTDEVSELRASMAALEATKNGEIEELSNRIASLGDEKSGLEASLKDVTTSKDGEITSLSLRVEDLSNQVETLAGEKTSLEASVADLSQKNESLTKDYANLSDKYDTDTTGLSERLAGLEQSLEDKSGEMTTLSQSHETSSAQQTARISALETQNENIKDELAKVTGELSDSKETVETLRGQFDDLSQELTNAKSGLSENDELRLAALARGTELENQLAAASDENSSLKEEIDGLKNQVSELRDGELEFARLQNVLAEKDTKIAELMSDLNDVPAGDQAKALEICDSTARSLLETRRINFETNSAELLEESVAVMERVTGIVLACFGSSNDATLTISGHTDSRGDRAENQELSELRARSIATFMANRGVDATMLVANGFGEDRPIADNDTEEGRTANRRISLDFSLR